MFDFLTRLVGGDQAAEQQIDPTYGVPVRALDNQRGMALLQSGLTLLAAGQKMTPEARANLLANAGSAFRNVYPSAEDAIRMRLWQAQANKAQSDAQQRAILLQAFGLGGQTAGNTGAPVGAGVGVVSGAPVIGSGPPVVSAAPTPNPAGPGSASGAIALPPQIAGSPSPQPPTAPGRVSEPIAIQTPQQWDPNGWRLANLAMVSGNPHALANFMERYKLFREERMKQIELNQQRAAKDEEYNRAQDDKARDTFIEKRMLPAQEAALRARDALVLAQVARGIMEGGDHYANTIPDNIRRMVARLVGQDENGPLQRTEQLGSTLARLIAGNFKEFAGAGAITEREQILANRIAGRGPTGDPLTDNEIRGALLAMEGDARRKLGLYADVRKQGGSIKGFDRYAAQFEDITDPTVQQAPGPQGVTRAQLDALIAKNPDKADALRQWYAKYGGV